MGMHVHFQDHVDQHNSGTNAPLTALSPVESTYTSLIQQYLSLLCVDNATFLAERFVATKRNNHSIFLLGMCYYRQGKPQRTRAILQEAASPLLATNNSNQHNAEMLYLLAKCHFELEDYGQAEEALLRHCRLQHRKTLAQAQTTTPIETQAQDLDINNFILKTSPCPIPNGAAGLHLLGQICQRSNRKQRAVQYYRMAVQLDPMMWSSFEALCELGVDPNSIDPVSIFGVNPLLSVPSSTTSAIPMTTTERRNRILTPSASFTPHHQQVESVLQPLDTPASSVDTSSLPKTSLFHSVAEKDPLPSSIHRTSETQHNRSTIFETPNLTPIPKEQSFIAGNQFQQQQNQQIQNNAGSNIHVIRRARKVASRMYYKPSPETTPFTKTIDPDQDTSFSFLGGLGSTALSFTNVAQSSQHHHQGQDSFSFTSEKQTKENGKNLFASSNSISKTTMIGKTHGNNHTVQKQRQQSQPTPKPQANEGDELRDEVDDERRDDGVQEILELLSTMGTAQLKLGQFRSKEAIEQFRRLAPNQLNTGWVLHQIGRAYFEMADYHNSVRTLQMMEKIEPHRMQGLEVLSTALWQLKREVELSHLAQRVSSFDQNSAEVWCVVGNCFSLQKEHETALTFFRRSIQLDPSFTYSHTLSGHEYFSGEEFDKAVACYRDAIRADERHYNAWYGLGAIYHRQEKFDLAEYHFHKACSINPQSSVLICHLGMAQNANGKPYEALDTLRAAFQIDPRNPQAHYQRGLVYQSLDRNEEALQELEKVRDAAPREAQIHFAMGRVHKRMGQTEKAMRCFLNALDLDPKDTNLIKAAMEKMDEPDIEEESSAF